MRHGGFLDPNAGDFVMLLTLWTRLQRKLARDGTQSISDGSYLHAGRYDLADLGFFSCTVAAGRLLWGHERGYAHSDGHRPGRPGGGGAVAAGRLRRAAAHGGPENGSREA